MKAGNRTDKLIAAATGATYQPPPRRKAAKGIVRLEPEIVAGGKVTAVNYYVDGSQSAITTASSPVGSTTPLAHASVSPPAPEPAAIQSTELLPDEPEDSAF